MGSFEIIKGEVTRVQSMQTVSGSVHNGRGRIKTKHKTTFSIGSQAAEINGTAGQYLTEDDEIIAVGEHGNNGVFYVQGFKNKTTGVLREGSFIVKFILAACCIFLGLWTFFLVITPIIFIPLGILAIYAGLKQRKANIKLSEAITSM